MSVICQNFVENAWKKDLCSNCFKSVGDHESIDGVEQDGENPPSSISDNHDGGKHSSQTSNNETRHNETPHTTWKTLITERNNKNSQPFKLENGFQGRLLTINKALNGSDKLSKGETTKDAPKSQRMNGISIKTTNGDPRRLAVKSEGSSQTKVHIIANGKNLSNGNSSDLYGKVQSNSTQKNASAQAQNKQESNSEEANGVGKSNHPEPKQIQSKLSKSNSEEVTSPETPLHSILKKNASAPLDNGCHGRRTSNVGFKDEEPLVIGYGGRDFSPEELEWETASSDGEAENGTDSLDETEDDKVFSKMTRQNTEFNSDNSNLLLSQKKIPNNKSEARSQKKTEIIKNESSKIPNKKEVLINSPSRKAEGQNSKPNTDQNSNPKEEKHKENTQPNEPPTKVVVERAAENRRDTTNSKTNFEPKGANDPVTNVAANGDKTSQATKAIGVTLVNKTQAADSGGVDVKNNSEFLNGTPASSPSNNTAAAQKKIESGKACDAAVMFSDTNWPENSSAEGGGNGEWREGDDGISGQILQAINTSLTNRHKMRENPELTGSIDGEDVESVKNDEVENEKSKISVSVNNEVSNLCGDAEEYGEIGKTEEMETISDMQPRVSFLHGIATKPSAIYGPAADLFVSRSNSSSSSSSDEQGKSQISLSINIRQNTNGGASQQCNENIESDNEEDYSNSPKEDKSAIEKTVYASDHKSKPEIPAKPAKQLSPEKYKLRNYSSKTGIKDDNGETSYYSSEPERSSKTSINLVDPYAESNIYQEVDEKDIAKIEEPEPAIKLPARESKLAALAIELEQVRHSNSGTKRQAPAPPKIPDPPQEDPPSCAGRTSPVAEMSHNFPTFRGESMGFSSASSTTSTSSQDTETGYASWNLHGDSEDHPKHAKSSKSSFLLTQYSKCKMLAMGYAEDGAKARKRFSIKKLLKIGKETEAASATFDPNSPNPKAWKYSDHFERPRAKLEIIHPMDLENKSVTVNPGFESCSMSSFGPNTDELSFRNSVSSDYGSFYSDTLSPVQDVKQEANYEYIQPRQSIAEENEESSSKAGTSSSTSPTPSRSSTASQASTVTSGSSKNGAVASHRPPKPPPPPRAHSLLPGNKTIRNPDGTFKFPAVNGDTSSSDEVTVTVTKPQAPKRQCKSALIRSEYSNLDQAEAETQQQNTSPSPDDLLENDNQDSNGNTSSVQMVSNESQINCIYQESNSDVNNSSRKNSSSSVLQDETENNFEQIQRSASMEGVYDNLEASKESKIQTSITIKTSSLSQKETLSKPALSRNKHSPLTKAPARPPPIYSKPQTGNYPKNVHPWKTLEDSYLALTSSNRELLIKLVNQALKKRKNYLSNLRNGQFQWSDFEIDASQPSSVFAFGEKIAYHATMPKHPEYSVTLVISIQQQNHMQENSDIKYPLFGKFTDCIPSELLDSSGGGELESMPATILVMDRSNILTVEYFSESLPELLGEENEKEVCFITLQLIQSLKSLQAQGIESIDTNCQNLLLAKTKHDRYHTLVFLYDICYEENDYSSDSCKISLCQYTLMLLLQMLKIQGTDHATSKFSSAASCKVFETAFSLLSEEKAVSLSQTKTLFECYLWGVTKVLDSLQKSDDCDSILHRWLDIERSNCIKLMVNDEESGDLNVQNEYYSQFLIRSNVRNIREVASYL